MRHGTAARLILLALFTVVVEIAACSGARDTRRLDLDALDGTLQQKLRLTHDGEERFFHLFVSNAEGPRPLVFALHGGGGTIDNHIGIGTPWPHQVWLQIASEEGLHVVVPQGKDSQWNDCRAECERCGDADDVGFLVALLDEVGSMAEVDRTRVYAVGESNGGFMAQRLAQEVPEHFAGMGVVISAMPTNNDCTAQNVAMPMIYQVGTEDSFIPFEGGTTREQIEVQSNADSVAYWRDLNGCNADDVRDTSYDDLDPDDDSTAARRDFTCTEAALSVITITGAGHVAPSIVVPVSAGWEALAGEQNHDIEGAREIWAFFAGDFIDDTP